MITLDKDTKHMKTKLAVDFADLIYNGKWFTPLREALQAFAVDTQKHVTGTVKLKLYKGNIITAGVTSPETLYSENLVTFEESDYNQDEGRCYWLHQPVGSARYRPGPPGAGEAEIIQKAKCRMQNDCNRFCILHS